MAKIKKEFSDNEIQENEGLEVSEPIKKTKQFKVRKDLGFEKRNYFIDGRNILLVAGESVDTETYNLFDDHCKKVFFE